MIQVSAEKFVHIGRVLQSFQQHIRLYIAPQTVLTEVDREQALAYFREIKADCDALRLDCTGGMLEWAIGDYSQNSHSYDQTRSTVEYISATFQQELARHVFMYIESDKADFFRGPEAAVLHPPFGAEINKAFGSILRDSTLAGNCYACGFNDSSVFHSMRVLEKGLEALAKVFNVDFSNINWHNVIEQIESHIRKMDPNTHGPDWKKKQQFYSEAACEFMFIKAAWRNHVMHGREKYDAEQASNIYSHTCEFMKRLTTGGLTA
jgi:hypothetical protein